MKKIETADALRKFLNKKITVNDLIFSKSVDGTLIEVDDLDIFLVDTGNDSFDFNFADCEVFEFEAPKKFDVVEWFAEKCGKTYYRDEIASFVAIIRMGGLSEAVVASLNAHIEEIRRMAQDRYDDWVSDLDY